MDRFCRLGSFVFTCVGMAFLLVALLAVPSKVFADDSCATCCAAYCGCGTNCSMNPCYTSCVTQCQGGSGPCAGCMGDCQFSNGKCEPFPGNECVVAGGCDCRGTGIDCACKK